MKPMFVFRRKTLLNLSLLASVLISSGTWTRPVLAQSQPPSEQIPSAPAPQPQTPQDYFQQGLKLLHSGHYAEAATQLEAYNRLQADDLPGLTSLAEAYLSLKKTELAAVTLAAAQKLDRNDPQVHLLKGRLELLQGHPEKARAHFRTLIYLKVANAESQYWLAQAESQLGHSEAALTALQEAFKDREQAPATTARLLLLQAQLEPEQREKALKTALELKGLSPELKAEVQATWASEAIAQGNVRELVDDKMKQLLVQVDQLSEDEIVAALNQMQVWISRSDDAAVETRHFTALLDKARDQHPANAVLRRELIRNYLRQGLYEYLSALYQWEMISYSKFWSEQERAAGFHRLADVELRLGGAQMAFENYQRAVELDETDLQARQRMGVIYLSAGDTKSALKEFEAVLQRDPLDRKSRAFYALALAYDGQKDRAKEVLSQFPADALPDLRSRIEAVLVLPSAKPAQTLWHELIPNEEILSPQRHLLSKITVQP